MRSKPEADAALGCTVLDNRKERCRIQAELVLIQSLSLALDAQMDFQQAPESGGKPGQSSGSDNGLRA
jgi:hypothetical protein